MALDTGSAPRSASPESSGRDSPIPRQWKNQLGGDEPRSKDKAFRRYAAAVEKTLATFETSLEEWADYISFLNRLLKTLQSRPASLTRLPASATIAKRLSQCLNPSLPSGVHQKALEVYNYIFSVIGKDGLSRDLPLFLPGLSSTLSFASLSVRSPFLELLEEHLVGLDPRSLRPAMRSIILSLLPGLEEETSEDFERTLRILARFKQSIRPSSSEEVTPIHSTGDDFFWQCFFLASITGQSRRSGALAYLVRFLPALSASTTPGPNADDGEVAESRMKERIAAIVTTPEPGLLLRCFASGLADEQLLIQRGFLDLLVTHLPLNSSVLQSSVKAADMELLLRAAVGVVTRRDMSLNRRLWVWLLGPEPTTTDGDHSNESPPAPSDQSHAYLTSRTRYFEEFGLQSLTQALLAMIQSSTRQDVTERARPYRICLSLMDRWEIGGLIIPEVFLPVVRNVREFKSQAPSEADFAEVLRSASVFFDGIESGLIYGELVALTAQAIAADTIGAKERADRLSLVSFVLANFNVREEEMITVHAPLSCLSAIAMLEESAGKSKSETSTEHSSPDISRQVLEIAIALLELVPERAFPPARHVSSKLKSNTKPSIEVSNSEVLSKIRHFYVHEQGNIDSAKPPFNSREIGELLLAKVVALTCREAAHPSMRRDFCMQVRILLLLLQKTPSNYSMDAKHLFAFLLEQFRRPDTLRFPDFSSAIQLAVQLYHSGRIATVELSELVNHFVRHAWTFLSVVEPKYHVETVRHLWQLQSALSPGSRDIESALASLIVEQKAKLGENGRHSDVGRTFGVLWSHTLQDHTSDRRGVKTPLLEHRSWPRLSGADYYEVMLTQPLFLILDALLDERTRLYMTAKSWLNSMVGIDRLFLVLLSSLSKLSMFHSIVRSSKGDKIDGLSFDFSEEDDIELCLYYLRTLSNVLSCSGEAFWAIISTKHFTTDGQNMYISNGSEGEMTLQEFFVRVCVRCIVGNTPSSSSQEFRYTVSELHRFALTTLHHFFLSPRTGVLSDMHLENVLIERLAEAIDSQDAYVQVLLADTVYDALKLRDSSPSEPSPSLPAEKRGASIDRPRGSRTSLALSDARLVVVPPPPQLLKCLQAGISSVKSRPVLDHWIAFLAQCLPFYSDSVFQVLIPLVETLCKETGVVFSSLKDTFQASGRLSERPSEASESTVIYLLNGLEQVLARAHDQLLSEEARAQFVKNPDQPQSIFGSMVSGVFQSDSPLSRSATANDRLTVLLAMQDAVRMCYKIWSWGQGDEATQQDSTSFASFNHTSLRMRNRARRLLEHLFNAETLECLETVIDIWRHSKSPGERPKVFHLLSALDAARPRHAMPSLFNAIYSRTNPSALESWRKSTMTISLDDLDLVVFLVEYTRSLEDDAMDEIWQDCMTFLKDLLSNPFPHRQTLPNLLEFAAILGEKVDNTNFGEQRRMRRELGDLFLRLLTALFTTRPMTFAEQAYPNGVSEKASREEGRHRNTLSAADRPDDVASILSMVVPNLPKILVDQDKVLSAASTISTGVLGPTLRAKSFPDTVSRSTVRLLHELSRLQNNQKTWKKDVSEAFGDPRFFSMRFELIKDDWLPLLRQWARTDKERIPELVGRISAPSTAGIVFGVGATSARLEADRKTQVNLRRIATLVLASAEDTFVTDLPAIFAKLNEILGATSTSSPSSTTRADVYMVVRALVLKISPIHLALLWPVVTAEIHAALSSVVAPDNSVASDIYTNGAILQACKLLDLLLCVAPDDFQLHEWLFITDTIDAVYRASNHQPIALVDELSEELGSVTAQTPVQSDVAAPFGASSSYRRPLLGPSGLNVEVSLERKDELVAKVLRPFFAQLSIYAFESTYAMGTLNRDECLEELLKDVFDERTIVRSL